MPTDAPTIRRASIADVPAIGRIVNDCAEYGLMLHRSHAYLYEHVRDFFVATRGGEGNVIGVCGLKIIWANLAEVYALAVAPSQRGGGVGRAMVDACIDEAKRLGVRRIMSLTYERAFFEKLQFAVVDRQKLPLKVWSECLACAKNQACDEVAMILELHDVPEVTSPPPQSPPPDKYIVPVQLGVRRAGQPPQPDAGQDK